MSLRFVGLGLIPTLAGCSDLESSADVQALQAAVAPLHLDDPRSDVRTHVAQLDFRPIGLRDRGHCTGYTGTDARLLRLQAHVGIRCLRGATLRPGYPEHNRRVHVARGYARAYNAILADVTNGHFARRFAADRLTWTVPDRFDVRLPDTGWSGNRSWEIDAFWDGQRLGPCRQAEKSHPPCGSFVRILPGPGHGDPGRRPSRLSSSRRDGSDLWFTLTPTSLRAEHFPGLRYLGSTTKEHYFAMESPYIGYIVCWGNTDRYIVPAVDPGLPDSHALTCWTSFELANRMEVNVQVWGASLRDVALLLSRLYAQARAMSA
ncbi:hypothetical protein J7I44_12810 [Frateuria sp. MAH-13]|uniref:Lipoprotein n=1 Tax=Frateuria flava TaxID=2821489 RepID=A0ABS4DQ56_9GAMM|nr:hypothetical protein [Frateuria flava]MBP1475187.1 hypothetical protein [Frateuria flava]